eukprot:TRINITY_DN7049_c0_g1_i1.p1 TRINITY_DN7049_c0_g1~~TRINITY_DN7049_c0_g1_i1.p1  ORF type:complete len:250 (-),score=56.83 TRINITY_DN7049_c0_g1_i1:53-802(-)
MDKLGQKFQSGMSSLILRQHNSYYVRGPSRFLLKVSFPESDYGQVIGHTTHPTTNETLLVVRNTLGKEFKMKIHNTDIYPEVPPVGQVLRFRFMKVGQDGVPQYPCIEKLLQLKWEEVIPYYIDYQPSKRLKPTCRGCERRIPNHLIQAKVKGLRKQDHNLIFDTFTFCTDLSCINRGYKKDSVEPTTKYPSFTNKLFIDKDLKNRLTLENQNQLKLLTTAKQIVTLCVALLKARRSQKLPGVNPSGIP